MALKQGLGADRMGIRSEAFRERLRALGFERLAEVRREGDAEVPVEITDPEGRHIIAREAGRMGGKKGAGHKFKKGSPATRTAALLGLKKRWDNYRAQERSDLVEYKKQLEEAGLLGENAAELHRKVQDKLRAEMGGGSKQGSRQKFEARKTKSEIRQAVGLGMQVREHVPEMLSEMAMKVLPREPYRKGFEPAPSLPSTREADVQRSVEEALGVKPVASTEPMSSLEMDTLRSLGVDPGSIAPSAPSGAAALRRKFKISDE